MKRTIYNPVLLFSMQDKFREASPDKHKGIRLKNRRVCAAKDGDVFTFKFTYAKGWRKAVMYVPISQEALAAMVSLASAINDEEYAKELSEAKQPDTSGNQRQA